MIVCGVSFAFDDLLNNGLHYLLPKCRSVSRRVSSSLVNRAGLSQQLDDCACVEPMTGDERVRWRSQL